MESFSELLAESEGIGFKTGMYAKVVLDKESEKTIDNITKNMLHLKHPLNDYGKHITTLYTHNNIDLDYLERKLDIYINTDTIQSWKDDNGTYTYVLTLKSPELNAIWSEYMDKGATWDYPEYTPHLTLSYKEPEPISTIYLYSDPFSLHAVKEIVSELDP